ncbi:MAG: radical SAM protein [Nanoarchaeota archaeon]|nr:radical SAM protein [Nanoarchaeota archaeon]
MPALSQFLLKYIYGKPRKLILFVTSQCNLRCEHCFNWKNLNIEELSSNKLESFSNMLGKLDLLSISGGEPFLREDLLQICGFFIKNNSLRNVGIPTNGQLKGKILSFCNAFLKTYKDVNLSIYLSLDGPPEIHDVIRGKKGAYALVLETYKALVSLKKNKHFRLFLTTTLTNFNINHISKLLDLVKKEFPDIDFHSFEIMRGNPRNQNYASPSLDQLNKIKPFIFESYKSHSFYKNKTLSFFVRYMKIYILETYIKILKTKKQPFTCYAPNLHLVLDEKGNVYFCELTPAIGNIKALNLKNILDSNKAKSIFKSIKARKCYCVHSCFQQDNIILNIWNYPAFFWFLLKKMISP